MIIIPLFKEFSTFYESRKVHRFICLATMKAARTSETSANLCQNKRRYNPDDNQLHVTCHFVRETVRACDKLNKCGRIVFVAYAKKTEMLYQHVSGKTKEKHEKPQSG